MRKLQIVRCALSQKNVYDQLLHTVGRDYVRPYEVKDVKTPLMYSPDPAAQALGRWLAQQPTVPHIFVVSTAEHALQTLRAVIKDQSRLKTILRSFDQEVSAINGESREQTCRRAQKWLKKSRAQYADWHVCLIADHRFVLAVRKALEQWNEEDYVRISRELKPDNCDVAEYRGRRLSLEYFNRNYLTEEIVK